MRHGVLVMVDNGRLPLVQDVSTDLEIGHRQITRVDSVVLMFALARQLPEADASTQAGKWEKNRFMGVEITGKVLGVVGCGNIGSIVAQRAQGLAMRVIASCATSPIAAC